MLRPIPESLNSPIVTAAPGLFAPLASLVASLIVAQSASAVIVLQDDFVDDPDSTVPQIRADQDGPGPDLADIGVFWTDLGADNQAVVNSALLELVGDNSDGIDSHIRATIASVAMNEGFSVSFDINFGSGQVGTHLAIGNALGEDVPGDIITGGTGFYGVRFIKGGDIENWNGTSWDAVGTVADFSGQTVTVSLYETTLDISVGVDSFTDLTYFGPRSDFNQLELAFAGNNGSRSQTGLISADNIGLIPEPSSALLVLAASALLSIRRRPSQT